MEAEATASKSSNEQYRITTDADRTRPTFSNAEILETTARATAVEKDPAAFLVGEEMSSASGSCTPLQPATGGAGYYEATCNAGNKVEDRPRSCFIRLVPDFHTITQYKYYVVSDTEYGTSSSPRSAKIILAQYGVSN